MDCCKNTAKERGQVMANDMDKKLKDVQDLIAKKTEEIKELRKLEKAYQLAGKLEKKMLNKTDASAGGAAGNQETK